MFCTYYFAEMVGVSYLNNNYMAIVILVSFDMAMLFLIGL